MSRELNVRELLELERQIYQESIDRVLQQQAQLRDGELEDFVRRCKPFEVDRERELRMAQAQLKLSQRDARTLLEFDLQQAEDVFWTDKEQLKLKLVARVQRRRLHVEKRLKLPNTSNFKTAHVAAATQHERLEVKLLEKQLRRAQHCARTSFNFRHLSGGVLPTPQRIVHDVANECEQLQRSREREETAKMTQQEGLATKVKVAVSDDGHILVCQGPNGEIETFIVGDAVVLESQLTEEDFHGFVSAFTSEEVQLMLVCGSHVRVTFARLRSEQCKLHKRPEVILKQSNEDDTLVAPAGIATSLAELLRDPPDVRRRAAAVMNRLKRKTTIDIRRGF